MTGGDLAKYDWRRRLRGGGGFVAAAPVTNTDNLSLLCSA